MTRSFQEMTMELIETNFSPSLEFHVNYNLKFEIKISKFDQNWVSVVESTEESIAKSAQVNFLVHPSIAVEETSRVFRKSTGDAINTILTSLPVPVCRRLRRRLVEFSLGEAARAMREDRSAHRFKDLNLSILVQIENRFVLENSYMVPASESSVQLLREEDGSTEEGICCICCEGLWAPRESSLLRMPCDHVFHAHCINKWLNNSHYCPLCRFQMPTDD